MPGPQAPFTAWLTLGENPFRPNAMRSPVLGKRVIQVRRIRRPERMAPSRALGLQHNSHAVSSENALKAFAVSSTPTASSTRSTSTVSASPTDFDLWNAPLHVEGCRLSVRSGRSRADTFGGSTSQLVISVT